MSKGGKVTTNLLNIDIKKDVEKILKETGNTCVDNIKARAPRRRGKYANSWKSQLINNNETVVIYSDNGQYRLAHLLELGHRAKGGGYVSPREHIRPAYNVTKAEYLKKLKNIKITSKK